MKTIPDNIINRTGQWLIVGLLALAPFHAWLTIWASSITGGYTAWRLWPEYLLAVAGLIAIIKLVNNPGTWQKLRQSKVIIALLFYTVVIFAWSMLGLMVGETSNRAMFQGLVIDIRLPVAFLIAAILAPPIKEASAMLWRWLLIPAAIVIMFGLAQAFVLPQDFLKHFGYGPNTIMPAETIDQKTEFTRIKATLRGANPFGAYLTLIISLIAGYVLTTKRHRYLLLTLGLAAMTTLMFTYSRSAYIGTVVALALITWWAYISKLSKVWKQTVIAAGLGLVITFGGLSYLMRDNNTFQNVFFHTDESSISTTSSNEQRSSAITNGLKDVVSQPLGKGVGSAGPASINNPEGRIAENYFLQIGQEMGWIGISLFVIINLLVGRLLWQLRQNPLAIAWLAGLIGLSLVNMLSHAWTDETLALIWWIGAGLLIGPGIMRTESKHINAKNNQKIPKTT